MIVVHRSGCYRRLHEAGYPNPNLILVACLDIRLAGNVGGDDRFCNF